VHDPLASLVFCRIPNADLSIVNGVVRVRNGRLAGVDVPALVERHDHAARALVDGS
jgi:8-oxoguanine deaminase